MYICSIFLPEKKKQKNTNHHYGFLLREMETSIPKIEGLVASPAQPIEASHPARPMATKEILFQTFEDQKKNVPIILSC